MQQTTSRDTEIPEQGQKIGQTGLHDLEIYRLEQLQKPRWCLGLYRLGVPSGLVQLTWLGGLSGRLWRSDGTFVSPQLYTFIFAF